MRPFVPLCVIFLTASAAAASIGFASAPAAPAKQADPVRGQLLVSPAWLASHLKDPNLVLLHVGDVAGYASHIPGARRVTIDDLATSAGGLAMELPAPAELRSRLAAIGISDGSRIVVYYGQDWISPATRIVFTLNAAGLGAGTMMLDGGMAAWQREGRALTATVPVSRKGQLSPLRMQPVTVDANFVRTHAGKPGYALIDARSPAFYDGVQTGGGMGIPQHKTGHIPGARNIPFSTLTGSDLRVQPAPALARAFVNAGVKRGDTVIVYCHIGQQGTAIVFAARTLGYKAVLYDGSFEDWSRRNLPAETKRS